PAGEGDFSNCKQRLAQVEAAICPAPFFRFQGFCRVQKNEYPESVVIDTVPGVHLFVISEQDNPNNGDE
ncbi:hypothetical protein, partial [uncultured Cardiobacterium sp.]|uniref:hypothetical protein n=1 Tax=uncultured Cardiobacterium sp. TaxID=417619 RepID=UPI002617EC3E